MAKRASKESVVLRPTVIVGLGGTGCDVLLNIKKHLWDAFGKVPDIVRLLAFDTTMSHDLKLTTNDGEKLELDAAEFHNLTVAAPQSVVQPGVNPHIDRWWPANTRISAILNGAGQVRARGRLALFANSGDAFSLLTRAIRNVRSLQNEIDTRNEDFTVDGKSPTEVYVISSLAGGTGSGMFLDIGFMCRSIIADTCNITGVFILPWIFQSLPGTRLVKPNTYGALKELDYFMDFTADKAFTLDYGRTKVSANAPPFDLVYLLDGRNEADKNIDDVHQMNEFAADGVFLLVASQTGISNENAIDNIKTMLVGLGNVRGKYSGYGSFGVSKLEYPGVRSARLSAAEYAMKIVSDALLAGRSDGTEVEEETEEFMLTHRIREHEANDVTNAFVKGSDGKRVHVAFSTEGTSKDKSIGHALPDLYRTQRQGKLAHLDKLMSDNSDALLREVSKGLDGHIHQELRRASGIEASVAFLRKLEAKLRWSASMMDQEVEQQRLEQSGLKLSDALADVEETSKAVFGRARKLQLAVEHYEKVATRDLEIEVEIRRREVASQFFTDLRARVQSTLAELDTVKDVLRNVMDALESERLDLITEERRARAGTFSVFVEPKGEPAGAGSDVGASLAEMLQARSSSILDWSGATTDDVRREILEYASSQFKRRETMHIEDALKEDRDYQEKLSQVGELSVPLLKLNVGRIPAHDKDYISRILICGVGNSRTTSLENPEFANHLFPQGRKVSYVTTNNDQEIVLFHGMVGVPLFALQDIEQYKDAYNDPRLGDIPKHASTEWAQLMLDLLPEEHDLASLGFALGQAPIFNRIRREGSWYWVKTVKGGQIDGEIKLGAGGRRSAFQHFARDRELVDETMKAIDEVLQSHGSNRVLEAVETYLGELLESAENIKSQDVKDVVEDEITALRNYLGSFVEIR